MPTSFHWIACQFGAVDNIHIVDVNVHSFKRQKDRFHKDQKPDRNVCFIMIYTEINFRKKKLMLCHVTMYLKKKILHGSDKNITSFYDGYWAILSLMVNVETLGQRTHHFQN